MTFWKRIVCLFLLSVLYFAAVRQLSVAQRDSKKPPRVYTNDDELFNHPPSGPPPPDSAKKPADAPSPPARTVERLAPFVPTPMAVVEKMLSVAGTTSGDVVYDLGSGDGRIVIMAAQKYGAKSVGVELDRRLVEESQEAVRNANLDKLVTIVQGDLLQADVKSASVVAVYLLPGANEKLRPILEKDLKPGTRVVTHDMGIRGWQSAREDTVNIDNAVHYIYLYQVPEAFQHSRAP